MILGAVTGTLQRPAALVVGVRAGTRLVVVGRSTALTATQSRQIAAAITAGGSDHPWPEETSSGVFGVRRSVPITRVQPLVVEVAADSALQAGRYRHPVRMVRLRADLSLSDVATAPEAAPD